MTPSAHDKYRFRRAPGLALACAMACSGSISAPDPSGVDGNAAGSTMQVAEEASAPMTLPEDTEPAEISGSIPPPTDEADGMETTPVQEPAPDPVEEPAAPPPPPPPVEVCDAVGLVLQPRCGDSDCHRGVGIGNFGLGEEQAASYVDKAPVSNAPICGLMIDSVNPERSFILTKVTGGPPYNPDDCKDLMPIGRPLPQTEIDCLRSWLQQFEQ